VRTKTVILGLVISLSALADMGKQRHGFNLRPGDIRVGPVDPGANFASVGGSFTPMPKAAFTAVGKGLDTALTAGAAGDNKGAALQPVSLQVPKPPESSTATPAKSGGSAEASPAAAGAGGQPAQDQQAQQEQQQQQPQQNQQQQNIINDLLAQRVNELTERLNKVEPKGQKASAETPSSSALNSIKNAKELVKKAADTPGPGGAQLLRDARALLDRVRKDAEKSPDIQKVLDEQQSTLDELDDKIEPLTGDYGPVV